MPVDISVTGKVTLVRFTLVVAGLPSCFMGPTIHHPNPVRLAYGPLFDQLELVEADMLD